MQAHDELFALAEKLKGAAAGVEDEAVDKPTSAISDAAQLVGRSFSGSWQGYHSRVYYSGFQPPPPGAHFSQEWGLMDTYMSSHGSSSDWREHDSEAVKSHIRELAGNPNLDRAHELAAAASETFETAQSDIVSILQTELESRDDGFLQNLKKEIEDLEQDQSQGEFHAQTPSKVDAHHLTRVTMHKPRVATLRQVAAFPRSEWPPSRGMGGRLQWNTHKGILS